MRRITLFICCMALAFSIHAQNKKVERAIQNAIDFSNMSIVYDDAEHNTFHFLFHATGCSFEKDEVRKFPSSSPDYVITDLDIDAQYKWGYYNETVTGFYFYRKNPTLNTLEYAIQLANHNNGLHVSYHDVNTANSFYQQYVKQFSELSTIYKKQFFPEFCNYVKTNPEGMKQFCDASPYNNNELVKELNVWDLLSNCNKSMDYVYYLTSNNGFIFSNNGDFRYKGDIKNGKADGQGEAGTWKGTYRDGKRNGPCTQSTSATIYSLSDTGIGGFYDKGWFFFKSTGTCINDEWDGEVVMEVTHQNSGALSDIEKQFYSKGKLVRKELVSDRLSKDTRVKIEQEKARLAEQRRREEAARNAPSDRNIMRYVKSVTKNQYFSDEYKTTYNVVFTDGRQGQIAFIYKELGVFGGVYERNCWAFWKDGIGHEQHLDGLPNTKEGAMATLYRYLLKYGK